MKFVGYIKGLAEGYAIQSEDSVFELKHLSDVAYFSEKLAVARGLDPNLALIIAYGHDLGRIKNGIYGKGHSEESAKIVRELIEQSEIKLDALESVLEAISVHNQKSKIHGGYAELIKDADALAHLEEELIDPTESYEHFRVKALETPQTLLMIASLEAWVEAYLNCLKQLIGNLQNKKAFIEAPDKWVHAQRVLVRKTRSILWFFKKNVPQSIPGTENRLHNRIITIDKALKDYFSTLSKARRYYGYAERESQDTKGVFYKQKHLKALKKIEYFFETEKNFSLISQLKVECDSDVDVYERLYLNPQLGVNAFSNQMKRTLKCPQNDIKRLHQLRISGKKFKYLSEMALFNFQPSEVIDALNRLHDNIGKLNDLSEMMALKNWKVLFNKPALASEFKRNKKISKENIFFFHLLSKNEIIVSLLEND